MKLIKMGLRAISSLLGMRPAPLGKRFPVGRGTYGEPLVCRWRNCGDLRIGAFCSISAEVTILLGGEHRTDWLSTYPFPRFRKSAEGISGHPATKGDVIIGNDVWIGYRSTILSGVTIGNGAVVGACSVVTSDIPSYAIVAGNPARVIRKRFMDEDIEILERIAWWEWPDSDIDAAMSLILSGSVMGLAGFAERRKSAQ